MDLAMARRDDVMQSVQAGGRAKGFKVRGLSLTLTLTRMRTLPLTLTPALPLPLSLPLLPL